MATDKKHNIVFKTRENNASGSGFNCSSKEAILKKINKLPISVVADSNETTEHQYCVLYELLFRKLNRDKYNKKRWLFDMVSYDKDNKRNTFFCYPTVQIEN
jgi:urease accessory protein UreH